MNLQGLMALVKMELKKLIREPANLFLMLLFPMVLTLTFGVVFGDPELGMDINVLVPGLISYACIFIIMTIAQSFTTERQEGLLKRMNTTPMTAGEFMGSHIITNMLIAILQVVVVFVMAVLIGFRPNSGVEGIFLALPIAALFSLSSVGLGLITATVSKTPEAATGISFVFILPQMFFGTFIPLTDTTRQIAMFMPSYYVVDALTLIFGGNWTNANVLLDVGVISIVSVAIVTVGILLFKKYGKA
ncbi:MAG: ABC transporter permease [Candidatus Bathyarchaeota archaeon]|nr:MAG: ABC transporter permease [Candidatus Bathyarchaeota archaeon]